MLTKEQVKIKLLSYWQIDELKFIAEFHRPKNEDGSLQQLPFGFFRNLRIASKDRTILYPKYDGLEYNRQVTFRQKIAKGLVDGQYYLIELTPDEDSKRNQNPFLLKVENVYVIDEYKSPPEFIRNWFFRKGENPEDASTIASQLKLNELELYTHTKRFIFELIQNADDMPLGNTPVNIELFLLANHLLFLHNGKYFDREDVKAISDAAKSTKAGSVTQTGYKGIGFKSVFTDSFRVYIKSGDYSFKFDKLAPVYTDFWALYSDYYHSKTPQAKREFEREYKGREALFTNIDRIPWQIKPIWVNRNEYPEELLGSPFFMNQQVAIALEIGSTIFQQKDYHGMISGLMKEPRFLLFLRNTRSFTFKSIEPVDSISIAVKNSKYGLEVYRNEELSASYIREEFVINIGNDEFEKAGLNFKRRELEGGKIEFYDNNGLRLENIPEKLGRLQSTVVSFAAKVSGTSIEELSKDETILFNYLPTSDQRFGFPFLVNADFVSKTDREFIQIENKWNHYIFYHIGINCIRWISQLGQIVNENLGKKFFPYAKTYLNLLPESFLDEDNEEQSSINKSFNHGIKTAIDDIAFVLDSNGALKKCSEIVIDETGISSVLGAYFFKTITSSVKSLPHLIINHDKLKKEYLNIDKFTVNQLKDILSIKENQTILSITIGKLDEARYKAFLKWLDGYSLLFSDEPEWFCSLPIVKLSDGICSITDALQKSNVHIRSSKTKSIEPILERLGYELTQFYIDDYVNLFDKLWHTESYLNKDLKLYERIALKPQLTALNAKEKSTLIAFIKLLDGVGETKYADTLKLFKSKTPNSGLKPLSSLISNSCKDIPKWLSAFIIDEIEERELSQDFKKHLIEQENILEKIFCNAISFDEIKNALPEAQLEPFYSYILILKNALPVDKVLAYTGIPWIYIPTLKSFQLPAEVYCPDSLLKLSTEKYDSVKAVIESISSEKLPSFSALSIIESFALGCKKVSVSSICSVPASIEMSKANDFLDWSASNGEKDLLRLLSIEKSDSEFVISKSPGQIHYYSNNKELIASIESHSNINSKLLLLPSELYSPERHSIGLMQDDLLLKYLLENGIASLSFIKFIYPLKDEAIKNLFIEKLPTIDLLSTQQYDKESDEHKMLDMIIGLGKEDDKYYESVISKVTIDGHGLSKKNISDDVIFKFPAKENSPERRFVLKLSKILPTYEDDTAALTTVIGNFIDIKNVNTLRKVFKTAPKKTDEIFNEIHSLKTEYLTPSQMFFLLLFQEGRANLDFKKGKLDFDEYWFDKDKKQYEDLSTEFVNILFKEGYFKFQEKFSFNGLVLSNKITNEIYAVENEQLPAWVLSWLNDEAKDAKIGFLVSAGLNNDDSAIVSLRKGIIDNDKDLFEKGLANTDNTVLLGNTAIWLLNYQNVKKVSFTKLFLKPLYLKFESKKLSIVALPLPTMQGLTLLSYQLILKSDSTLFHSSNDSWGDYSIKIFNSIVSSGAYVIDDVLPPSVHKSLNSIVGKPSIEADASQLLDNSKIFSDPYYSDWPHKAKYQIFIYNGFQLPYLIKYQTLFSENIAQGKSAMVNNIFYVTVDDKDDLPFPLKGLLPESIYLDLVKTKSEFDRKKNREQYEISYSDEESKALNRLFGDEIPRGFHKDLNLASLIKGLIYLSNNGYDIAEAEDALRTTHEYSQLYPVYANGVEKDLTNALKVKCRSAKSGLLYLRASSWQELEKENIYMYVLTGKDNTDCRFCTTREAVIEDAKADYRVLRIEANNGVSDIDDIIQGKFDPENLWLIIRMADKKEYKSIFEKIRENEANDTINNANMGDESHD